MFTVYPDCQLTRRKRLHFVVSDDGDVYFSASDLSACINWIYEQGHMEALVEVAGHDQPWKLLAPSREYVSIHELATAR